jgi:hypothetical protein
MDGERGQATLEWTAVMLVLAVALATATYAVAALDAPWIGRAIRCAILAGCRGEDALLARVYGPDAAAFVRAYAPSIVYERGTLTLPVDFRECRAHRCSDAPDTLGEDVAISDDGRRATVFTHVVDRRASGGDLFVQYWLYYPDSTYFGPAYAAGRAMPRAVARTPIGTITRTVAGHHADDWESYQLRITPEGKAFARASAHHGYAGRLHWPNLNELPFEPGLPGSYRGRRLVRRRTGAWTPVTGWTRVSRGSHAGHIVADAGSERRTESNGLVLVPIERMAPADRHRDFAILPPWNKPVYAQPDRNDT